MANANPMVEFSSAVERAAGRGVDTSPVALATADAQGRPALDLGEDDPFAGPNN